MKISAPLTESLLLNFSQFNGFDHVSFISQYNCVALCRASMEPVPLQTHKRYRKLSQIRSSFLETSSLTCLAEYSHIPR